MHRNHPDNHKVNFTLLLQPGYWFHGQEAGSNETWAQELDRYVSYVSYDNRPTFALRFLAAAAAAAAVPVPAAHSD